MSEPKLELGSDAWVAEARRHLIDAVGQVADTLEGVRFSLCEVYTDPPPHLGDGTRVSWHLEIEGDDVRVDVGERDDLDQKITVDYATCIPLAKELYPEIVARPGTTLPDSQGPPRVPGPLVPTLVAFHNHMARHTR